MLCVIFLSRDLLTEMIFRKLYKSWIVIVYNQPIKTLRLWVYYVVNSIFYFAQHYAQSKYNPCLPIDSITSLLPVTQSVSITRTPESRRASGSSTYGLGIQLAFAVSGTAGGLIADRFGYTAMFLSLIVPSMAAMLLGLWKGNFPVSPAAGGSDRNGTNDPGNG